MSRTALRRTFRAEMIRDRGELCCTRSRQLPLSPGKEVAHDEDHESQTDSGSAGHRSFFGGWESLDGLGLKSKGRAVGPAAHTGGRLHNSRHRATLRERSHYGSLPSLLQSHAVGSPVHRLPDLRFGQSQ